MSEDGKNYDLEPGKLYIWDIVKQEWVVVGEFVPHHPAKQLAIDSVDRASKN